MNVLIAASAIFTLIGLLFLAGTLRAIRRGRLLRASSSFVSESDTYNPLKLSTGS